MIDSCNFDNVDLIAVNDMLGHYSVRTTERYNHSNSKQKLNAAELSSRENSRKKEEKMVNLSIVCHTEKEVKAENSASH